MNSKNSKMMRTTIFILSLIFSSVTMNAQVAKISPYLGSATFFTEEGEKFTLYLNGVAQNTAPDVNVKVEDLTDININVRIVFEDPSIPPIKKSIMRFGVDCNYALSKDKKGQYGIKGKGCTGTFNVPNAAADMMAAQHSSDAAAASSAPSGPKRAEFDGSSFGDPYSKVTYYYVHKSKTSGMPTPRVIMKQPEGAKVTITYDNSKEKYETEVPFTYEVQDYNNNNADFRMDVVKPNGDAFYVRLKNNNGYQLLIDDDSFGK